MTRTTTGIARGVTLIELMISVVVLVIVIAIGVPGLQGLIHTGRLSSGANELSAAVQLARAEAIRRNRSVVLCRSDTLAACADGDTWGGWMVFVDDDADGAVGVGEEVLKTGRIDAPLVMRASAGISSRGQTVTFLPGGLARGADEAALLNAALSLCTPSTVPTANVRDVLIAFGGRTSVRSRGTGGVCTAAPADT